MGHRDLHPLPTRRSSDLSPTPLARALPPILRASPFSSGAVSPPSAARSSPLASTGQFGLRHEGPGVAALAASSFRLRKKARSEEHTTELQSRQYLVCRLL